MAAVELLQNEQKEHMWMPGCERAHATQSPAPVAGMCRADAVTMNMWPFTGVQTWGVAVEGDGKCRESMWTSFIQAVEGVQLCASMFVDHLQHVLLLIFSAVGPYTCAQATAERFGQLREVLDFLQQKVDARYSSGAHDAKVANDLLQALRYGYRPRLAPTVVPTSTAEERQAAKDALCADVNLSFMRDSAAVASRRYERMMRAVASTSTYCAAADFRAGCTLGRIKSNSHITPNTAFIIFDTVETMCALTVPSPDAAVCKARATFLASCSKYGMPALRAGANYRFAREAMVWMVYRLNVADPVGTVTVSSSQASVPECTFFDVEFCLDVETHSIHGLWYGSMFQLRSYPQSLLSPQAPFCIVSSVRHDAAGRDILHPVVVVFERDGSAVPRDHIRAEAPTIIQSLIVVLEEAWSAHACSTGLLAQEVGVRAE